MSRRLKKAIQILSFSFPSHSRIPAHWGYASYHVKLLGEKRVHMLLICFAGFGGLAGQS